MIDIGWEGPGRCARPGCSFTLGGRAGKREMVAMSSRIRQKVMWLYFGHEEGALTA